MPHGGLLPDLAPSIAHILILMYANGISVMVQGLTKRYYKAILDA